MEEKVEIKISKFLSLVLRHKPDTIDIELDENGWVNTSELLQKMKTKFREFDLKMLKTVVENNSKQRFTFNADLTKIRANQGHSLNVNLELSAKIPPKILYHGTAEKFVSNILKVGLIKKNRNHVHLSHHLETAFQVGKRHGKPVIFEIDSLAMHNEGFLFFFSKNGVWLTDSVLTKYIKTMDSSLQNESH